MIFKKRAEKIIDENGEGTEKGDHDPAEIGVRIKEVVNQHVSGDEA